MPNAGRAVVEIEKLRGYCLSAEHPRGRHKARVFAAVLGLSVGDAEALQQALHDAAMSGGAVLGGADNYGQRYVIDFIMRGPAGAAVVRGAWIIRRDEDFPRFVSCYVR